MNILVVGEQTNLSECEQKFGAAHRYTRASDHRKAEKLVSGHDVVFDFKIADEPHEFKIYQDTAAVVFLNTVTVTLAQLALPFGEDIKGTFFGFNGIPTFLPAPILEVALLRASDRNELHSCCSKLETTYSIVLDRVGLVTPRVIGMIINEAYFTVQDRTASREDIDLAMKLGTNYPYGPFEWCQRIGIRHIYELLTALYENTKDDRYKICPLLESEYLKSGNDSPL
jgi:3-hydroxybutyryl-CoA dehydrogenase